MNLLYKEIAKYNDKIEAFKIFDPNGMELYRWLIELGKKLQNDPLSVHLRTEKNRVSRCQFGLFVDKEEDKNKKEMWSMDDLISLTNKVQSAEVKFRGKALNFQYCVLTEKEEKK